MEDEAEDSEDEEYQQLGRNWLMVRMSNFKDSRHLSFGCFVSFFFLLSYKPLSESQELIPPRGWRRMP